VYHFKGFGDKSCYVDVIVIPPDTITGHPDQRPQAKQNAEICILDANTHKEVFPIFLPTAGCSEDENGI
jgi:hypothetical protein